MALAPEPHNSVCPGIFPEIPAINGEELLRVLSIHRAVGSPEGGASGSFMVGSTTSQVHGNMGGMAPATKLYNLVKDTPSLPRLVHPDPGS